MAVTRLRLILLLFLFVLLQTNYSSFCQSSVFPIHEWASDLKETNDPGSKKILKIENELSRTDRASVARVLSALEKTGAHNHYFNARLLYFKGWFHLHFDQLKGETYAREFYARAMKEAYYTSNQEFISYMSWRYGSAMAYYQEIELAAAYLVNAVELNKNLLAGNYDPGAIQYLGEILFHARVYDKSIYYTRAAIDSLKKWPGNFELRITKAWNTLGQGYQKTGNLDSALICYQISSALAYKLKSEIWEGINAGFMGQVYFLKGQYDKAEPLLRFDYNLNKAVDSNIAGYSLHWLGRIYLVKGDTDSALLTLREALKMLETHPQNLLQNRPYLENAYYAMADAYRKTEHSDSFYHYFQLYTRLHDSIRAVAERSSLDVAQMRIDKEKNMYAVQLLEQQKESEELKRNFLIAAILLLSVIAILMLNRRRVQSKYRQQLALKEKIAAEHKMAAASEQLQLFTNSMIEKTTLIETLQLQLKGRELNSEQQQLLAQLSHQTILTEEDWDKFKRLFDNLHPGFFNRLKEKTPGITIAELRMAALTRLRLGTKEMASMLGVSPDTVRKTRQRLRQRLQIPEEANLEHVIAGF